MFCLKNFSLKIWEKIRRLNDKIARIIVADGVKRQVKNARIRSVFCYIGYTYIFEFFIKSVISILLIKIILNCFYYILLFAVLIFGGEVAEGVLYIAADDSGNAVHDVFGTFHHVVPYPIQKHADERVFIKIGYVLFIVLAYVEVFALFVHDVFKKRVYEPIQILFENFKRNGAVNIVYEYFILFCKFENG